jgi:hypothetical protein
MILRSTAAWFLLLLVAILNGAFREAVLVTRTGHGAAHAISTVTLSVAILLVGWLVTPWIAPKTLQDAWTIGLIWLVLTLAFEFLAGHFLFGRTWTELFADYNLLAGRIWLMVLIVTVLTPVIAFTRTFARP